MQLELLKQFDIDYLTDVYALSLPKDTSLWAVRNLLDKFLPKLADEYKTVGQVDNPMLTRVFTTDAGYVLEFVANWTAKRAGAVKQEGINENLSSDLLE